MREDRVYLVHIQEAIDKVFSYSAGGRDAFIANPMAQDAIIRNFEIIGEATKRLAKETKQKQPDIPWRRIAGLRDVLIHNYMGVDLDEVWGIIEDRLPALQRAVQRLLES